MPADPRRHEGAADEQRPPRPAGRVGQQPAGVQVAEPGQPQRLRGRHAGQLADERGRRAAGDGQPDDRVAGGGQRPGAGAPPAHADRRQRAAVALGQRRRRRAVGDALGDEPAPRAAGAVVDDGGRLVAAPPPGLDQAPHGVDVLAEAQAAVEPADRPQRVRPHDQRRRRHVAEAGARRDAARLRAEVERGVPLLVAGQRTGARRAGHARRDQSDAVVGEVGEQAVDPARLEPDVGVDERDQRRGRRPEAGVAGDGRDRRSSAGAAPGRRRRPGPAGRRRRRRR